MQRFLEGESLGIERGETVFQVVDGEPEPVFLSGQPQLPGQTQPGAAGALERICAAVQRLGIEHVDNPAGVLTLSAGVSAYVHGRHTGGEQLLKEADAALYAAKAAGRNRVVLAENLRNS